MCKICMILAHSELKLVVYYMAGDTTLHNLHDLLDIAIGASYIEFSARLLGQPHLRKES